MNWVLKLLVAPSALGAILLTFVEPTVIGQGIVATIVALGYWANRKKVQEIHVMVNSQKQDLEGRIRQLEGTIIRGGDKPPPEVPPAPASGRVT